MTEKNATLRDTLASFPRHHMIAASVIAVVMVATLLLAPSHSVEAKRTPIPLDVTLTPDEPPVSAPQEKAVAPELPWSKLEVRKGDSLSSLFSRAGLPARELFALLNSNKESHQLKKLLPGEVIAFQIDAKQLLQLQYAPNKLQTTTFSREGDGFVTQTSERTPEVRIRYAEAELDSSLFLAGQAAGLSQEVIMELANIFGGVIDFVYDPRKGDTFSVMFEEKFLDGEKLGNGNILAARYVNQGEMYNAYRYEDDQGNAGYYSEDGVSMQKAFLRAPLDFTRISSGFNLKRLHPIFKTARPHRGIDYAASRGTPVYAAGEGRVVRAGYNKANGNYVVIQHGTQYVSKYLHLHKRYVRSGQKVKQKQIIGTVGSTGYATGPHLHYEFLVNGVHRNPRTIFKKLPKPKSLSGEALADFKGQLNTLELQLATYQRGYQLASVDTVN